MLQTPAPFDYLPEGDGNVYYDEGVTGDAVYPDFTLPPIADNFYYEDAAAPLNGKSYNGSDIFPDYAGDLLATPAADYGNGEGFFATTNQMPKKEEKFVLNQKLWDFFVKRIEYAHWNDTVAMETDKKYGSFGKFFWWLANFF